MFLTHGRRIAELVVKSRLPAIGTVRQYAENGFLMSYGTNFAELYRRTATYVDKILKGAKPADLPVEQPMRFELVPFQPIAICGNDRERLADPPPAGSRRLVEQVGTALVINMKTAKALGLTIPPLVLLQADQVIE